MIFRLLPERYQRFHGMHLPIAKEKPTLIMVSLVLSQNMLLTMSRKVSLIKVNNRFITAYTLRVYISLAARWQAMKVHFLQVVFAPLSSNISPVPRSQSDN